LIFAIFGCSAHSKNDLRRNGGDKQSGAAIGFRASCEH